MHGSVKDYAMVKKHSLLIVESDAVQQALLERALASKPYSLSLATNSGEALAAFQKVKHEVVLCDLSLAGADSGVEVLKALMNTPQPPIVVLLIDDSDLRSVIQTMRMGAFDYIFKPFEASDVQQVLERAHNHVVTTALSREVERERLQRIEQQLATRRITDQLVRRQANKLSKALFSNIHTAFAQGRGVGSLTTLVSMLAGSPTSADGVNYLIPKDILEMIFDNQKAASDMIEIFGELHLLVSQDFALFDVTLGEFHKIIHDIIFELQPLSACRGHHLLLNELPATLAGIKLKLNWELMRKAIRELLLNAMKFSPENSSVTVLVEYMHSQALVTVMNRPLHLSTGETTGIPEEYRKIVFEPFFRVTRVVHEQYQTLEYGLGLTYVDKIVQMHRGNIVCTTVHDYSTDSVTPEDLVAFEIELPT